MSTITVEQLYERQIKPLPPNERLKLVALIANELAREIEEGERPKRSIMELHGLGAEIGEALTHRNTSINYEPNGIIGHNETTSEDGIAEKVDYLLKTMSFSRNLFQHSRYISKGEPCKV